MAGRSAWVLGDQLSLDNPALEGAERVLMVESQAKLHSAPFHRQKLHLLLSAMRHFAEELRASGIEVDYRRAGSLAAGLREPLHDHRPDEVALLEPTHASAQSGWPRSSPSGSCAAPSFSPIRPSSPTGPRGGGGS